MKVAVLASGAGSTFENLVATRKQYEGTVGFLVVDRPCGATALADRLGVRWTEAADDATIFDLCRGEGIDVVCCAGWLRKLEVPPDFRHRVLNVHPSLLPAFGGRGMHGMAVHRAVAASGVKFAGCTVHFVTEEYDAGPIVLQRLFELQFPYTPERLAERVGYEEKIVYPLALRDFRWGLRTAGRWVVRDADQPDYRVPGGKR